MVGGPDRQLPGTACSTNTVTKLLEVGATGSAYQAQVLQNLSCKRN